MRILNQPLRIANTMKNTTIGGNTVEYQLHCQLSSIVIGIRTIYSNKAIIDATKALIM
jgi:hypothetical protein